MRVSGIKKKLYRLTYDKPGVNKKALQLKHSIDETKKLLDRPAKGKKKNS